jgi:hypothetical protein
MCEEHNNPADFFLDVLNGSIQPAMAVPLNNTENDEGSYYSVCSFTTIIDVV